MSPENEKRMTAVNPFAKPEAAGVNAGTVMVEQQRASAEVQAKLYSAKAYPRDQAAAYTRAMDACKRPALAAAAMYAFPRGGQTVSGPSIRLAEALAAAWGNIEYGIRELSRKDGVSEMQAFAWDLETNTSTVQNFTVRHERDTKGGKIRLTDERDIYEVTANNGGRRLRARILAVLPGDLVDAAIEECRRTLAGDNTIPLVDRVRKMIAAFDKLGVSQALIEKRAGKPCAELLPEDLGDLLAIHNSIKDGASEAGAWFDTAREQAAGAAAAITAAATGTGAETGAAKTPGKGARR